MGRVPASGGTLLERVADIEQHECLRHRTLGVKRNGESAI